MANKFFEELSRCLRKKEIESANYGQHLIQVSGHFEVKSELDSYIDYQKFGEHYIKKEGGVLGDRGYVAYLGNKPEIEAIVIRRITAEQNTQDFQLGDFS